MSQTQSERENRNAFDPADEIGCGFVCLGLNVEKEFSFRKYEIYNLEIKFLHKLTGHSLYTSLEKKYQKRKRDRKVRSHEQMDGFVSEKGEQRTTKHFMA